MKILGIIAGRPKRMTEYWCQAALKGAEEAGAEVELINLRQLHINPCNGCCVCHRGGRSDGKLGCVYDDDMNWLDEKIMECDGMIVCAPCFECSPPSEVKLFCDRLGPSHDVMIRRDIDQRRAAQGLEGNDPRWYKRRPCAFITHGGSEWTTLGLSSLSIIAVPLGMTIVGLEEFQFAASILEPKNTQRAKDLGRNVALNCGKAEEDMVFLGEDGHCPMCHNSTMILSRDSNTATCAVCGIQGTVTVENEKFHIAYTQQELLRSHVTDSGKEIHMLDMTGRGREEMKLQRARQGDIDAR